MRRVRSGSRERPVACVTIEGETVPPRSACVQTLSFRRRLSASISARSVKPASSPPGGALSPSRTRYSSRIQNGRSRPSEPSALTGTVSCSRHQASAATAVRCEIDRAACRPASPRIALPRDRSSGRRSAGSARPRPARPRQHRQLEFDADGPAVLEPHERLALDEAEPRRARDEGVASAVHGGGLGKRVTKTGPAPSDSSATRADNAQGRGSASNHLC